MTAASLAMAPQTGGANWQRIQEHDERRFTWVLGAHLCIAVIISLLFAQLRPSPAPAPITPEPPRIVNLKFLKPPPPPPPLKVKPKPPPPPPAVHKAAHHSGGSPHPHRHKKPVKARPKAGGTPKNPLATLEKALGSPSPSSPILASRGNQPLVSGRVPGAVGNSNVLTQGTTTGSGGIGIRGHGTGRGIGNGVNLQGNGTGRVVAQRLGNGGPGIGGGGRSSAELSAVFRRHQDQFTQAYKAAMQRNSTIGGGATLVLHLTIEANGSVSACSVVHGSQYDSTLIGHVIAIVKGMHFSRGVREKTSYTLRLLPT